METTKETPHSERIRQYVSPALHNLFILSTLSPLSGMQSIIHDRIWDSILNGELKPGSKVPELQIGAAFNVSRTIVRNVLIVMEQEEIISLPPNRGAYIALHTPEKVKQAFEATLVAARHIARTLADNHAKISTDSRNRLNQHVQFEVPEMLARNPNSHTRFGMEFLLLIAAVHGNTMLLRLLERATSIILVALPRFQFKQVVWPLPEQKTRILDAVFAGDADGAEQAIMDFMTPLEVSFDDRSEEQSKDVFSIISSLSEGLDLPSPARQRNAQRRKPARSR